MGKSEGVKLACDFAEVRNLPDPEEYTDPRRDDCRDRTATVSILLAKAEVELLAGVTWRLGTNCLAGERGKGEGEAAIALLGPEGLTSLGGRREAMLGILNVVFGLLS